MDGVSFPISQKPSHTKNKNHMNINALMLAATVILTQVITPSFAAETAWETKLRSDMHAMADQLTTSLKPWPVPERVIRVEAHGAVADGVTVNTTAIQAAIDACSAAGGGVVSFDGGNYVTGTIELKSGVMLDIAKNSQLWGSTKLSDYPDRVAKRKTVMDTHMGMNQSLIFAEGVERIGIRGLGTIDFRGTKQNFPGKQTIAATPGRPFGIRVLDSRQIVIEDITLKDSACWMQNYLNCEELIFQRMKVNNHANHNNDGIDIDGCRRVIVRDCVVNSEDDAMCIKGASLRPTEDVLIENSTFVSVCNAFKIGTDTQGDFRRIYARNLRLGGIPEDMHSSRGHQSSTGITLATVDGGDVEDILIEKCVVEQSRCPIFIRIGSRGRLMPDMPPAKIGLLQRIIIEDITGNNNFRQGSFISGIDGAPVKDVVIRRVNIGMEGGGTADLVSAKIREDEKGYPDAHRFSVKGLPSYGFYIRHAERVRLENIVVTPAKPDLRPFIAVGPKTVEVTLDGKPVPPVPEK
jgi:polygalacturonase